MGAAARCGAPAAKGARAEPPERAACAADGGAAGAGMALLGCEGKRGDERTSSVRTVAAPLALAPAYVHLIHSLLTFLLPSLPPASVAVEKPG